MANKQKQKELKLLTQTKILASVNLIFEQENPEAATKLKKKIKKAANDLSKSFVEECVIIEKKKAKAERKKNKAIETADKKETKVPKAEKEKGKTKKTAAE